ncbi:TonB-dependent receptor plug domain-containing protein [Bacteroides sp. OttesenSCG-928-J23]|nr:TonB-dependent receptor plug domain-containing protein [Bacteroides sp. OttesenSCG-928-N06]MDL2247548.1 TonB-dependent receptor plug domain-containing protein [Bacteroides sp. OttesenSCG-928-J23]MDL2299089.1 TonB-dependent receptor plug domain-containing protein [Bacteroides sp. OttesenSCG-928-E20]MDL2304140.1 TonB-dependent receptor plug domain-containing protein [Bacteroides sp. OttesenSCG-928-D19]
MKRKPFLRRAVQLLSICCLLFLSSAGLHAQSTVEVQGQVLESGTQEPLIGVSIQEKGTPNGTITDLDGRFTIKVSPNATLVLSYMGYVAQEFKAGSVPKVIILKEDAQVLDEVVVVGYGVQKKAHLTGAVSAVDGATLAKRKSANALSSLQGALPGVSITRSGGRPGDEGVGIKVRGVSSMNTADVLILIDGIEGSMTTLNPDDIESVSVLKDAAASAIYGARAAAGVVLVTTKKGTTGKAKISYNGSFGVNKPTYMPERQERRKNIKIKALNANKGSFKVLTFDSNGGAIAHADNIINSQTKDYEVRAFAKNYFVTVNVK